LLNHVPVHTLKLDKDPEIGVGRHVAWQTSLHREAVRKALEKHKS
jgi:hypothetical protein